MTNAAALIPTEPPRCFENKQEISYSDKWQSDLAILGEELNDCVIHLDIPSSSFHKDRSYVMYLLRQRWDPLNTVSWLTCDNRFDDLIRSKERAKLVNIDASSENQLEIEKLTGFSEDLLADLSNVDLHGLNNWVKSIEIKEKDREQLTDAWKMLREAAQSIVEINTEVLHKENILQGWKTFETIRQEDYEKVYLIRDDQLESQSRLTVTKSEPWIGEFQPMLVHTNADGTENVEAIPYEPEPASRKRTIRRD